MSLLITTYHTLSPRLEEKLFSFGNFKISFQAQIFFITSYHALSHLKTPYHTLSPRLERNHFPLAILKLVPRIMFLLHFALGIENSFPDRITRMSFYQKYYQLLLHGKFPMKEKKLLVVGPPDSGKTSWFAPFQGMLTNTDLLLKSEKVTAIICSGIFFSLKTCIEASQFICVANQLSGFQILRDFTGSYFGTDYGYLVTMSFIYIFNKN